MDNTRLTLKSKHRHLGLWLAFVAGAINASGFLVLEQYTSHMTGIASSIGTNLVLNRGDIALTAIAFLFSFIGGAIVTALLVNWLRDRRSSFQYSGVLLLEALLLLGFTLFAEQGKLAALGVALLCFLMGLQNALITQISGSTIRTTHITGLVTDIGIEAGRILYRIIWRNHNMHTYPDKLGLFALLTLCFIGGGIAGSFAFMAYGFTALFPVSALLIILALTFAKA